MSTVRRHSYPAIVLCLLTGTAAAYDVDFEAATQARSDFIDYMVATHDFDRDTLAAMLDEAEIVDSILEAISRPAERVKPWHEYRDIFLTDARIDAGAEFWLTYEDDIRAASREYGVAPEMLVAILGIETLYGQRTGSYRVLDSLSTLAFAFPPRAAFFASELEEFLLLVEEEGIDPRQTLGSYAGAMGAGQFISSSFRAYAIDGNGEALSRPELSATGLLETGEDDIAEDAIEAALDALKSLKARERNDDETVREAVRIAVRRAFRKTLGKRPVTTVHLIRLSGEPQTP